MVIYQPSPVYHEVMDTHVRARCGNDRCNSMAITPRCTGRVNVDPQSSTNPALACEVARIQIASVSKGVGRSVFASGAISLQVVVLVRTRTMMDALGALPRVVCTYLQHDSVDQIRPNIPVQSKI